MAPSACAASQRDFGEAPRSLTVLLQVAFIHASCGKDTSTGIAAAGLRRLKAKTSTCRELGAMDLMETESMRERDLKKKIKRWRMSVLPEC